MTKIYTPQEWRSFFPCPSIVIDDKGYIFSAEEYDHLLKTPIGRIDYSRNNIYGKDYNSWTATPIAYMVSSDGVTKVYEYGKTQFSDPMLYIQDNKIYTPQEYTRWFGGEPSGYVEKDDPTDFVEEINQSGTGSRTESSSSGDKSGGGAGCSLPFWVILLGAFFLYLVITSVKFLTFDMTGLGVCIVTWVLFSILTAKIGPVTHLEKNQTAVAQCKAKAKNSAAIVAVVCGVVWCYTVYSWFTKSGGRTEVLLLLLAMAVGFTLVSFFFAKQYFYRRYLTQSGGNATTTSVPPKKQSFSTKTTVQTPPKANKPPVTTKPPVTAKAQNSDPFNGVFDNKTIVRCPHCRAKCRVSATKGPSTVVCPNPACKKPFHIQF